MLGLSSSLQGVSNHPRITYFRPTRPLPYGQRRWHSFLSHPLSTGDPRGTDRGKSSGRPRLAGSHAPAGVICSRGLFTVPAQLCRWCCDVHRKRQTMVRWTLARCVGTHLQHWRGRCGLQGVFVQPEGSSDVRFWRHVIVQRSRVSEPARRAAA